DSCDPGSCSDVTEEAPYEIKEQPPQTVGTIASTTRIAKSEVEELAKVKSNGNLQHVVNREQKITIPPASGSTGLGFPSSIVQSKQNDDHVANNYSSSFSTSHQYLKAHSSNGSPESQSTPHLLPRRAGEISKEKTKGSQSEVYALVPHKAPKESGILEALKLAKQTLQRKINDNIPSVASSSPVGTFYDPSLSMVTSPRDRPELLVECPGLFRLPTDFPARVNGQLKFHPLNERTSLGSELLSTSRTNGMSSSARSNHHSGHTNPAASAINQRVAMRRYLEPVTNISTENQLLPGKQYPEVASRRNASVGVGLPSSRSVYPTFPASPAYGDLMFRMPSPLEGFSTFPPGRLADRILTSSASPAYGDLMSGKTSPSEGFLTFPHGGITDGIPPNERFSFPVPIDQIMYR
ncbi:hypothetical protein LINPERHAP1_LOCUS15295, partial [Linum perenne]